MPFFSGIVKRLGVDMLRIIKIGSLQYLVVAISLLGICIMGGANDQKTPHVATINSDGIQRIDILVREYFFNPGYIIVKVNIPVEIKIRKEPGIIPHRFVIKEPDTGIDIYESIGTDLKIIRFTPVKTGKYPFYCDKRLLFFKSHREKGMEGILEVGE